MSKQRAPDSEIRHHLILVEFLIRHRNFWCAYSGNQTLKEIVLKRLILAFVSLSMLGCSASPSQPIWSAGQTQGASAPATPGTLKGFQKVVLNFKKDPEFTAFKVYRTDMVDLDNSTLNPYGSGMGHLGFTVITGAGADTDGYRIDSVDTSTKEDVREVRFMNLGTVSYEGVKEVPEFGYNSPLPGKKSILEKISSGNVIAFRIDDKNSGTSYGKLLIKDMTSAAVTFDYQWQKNGTRKVAD